MQSQSKNSRSPFEAGAIGPLLAEVLAADSETRTLLSGPRLPAVVDALVSQAERLGYGALLGASAAGHNLVGAMSYRSSKLRPWTPHEDERVLVIDAVVAGVGGLYMAASHAHALGATETDALVVSISAAASAGAQSDAQLRSIFRLTPELKLVA